MEPNSIDDNQKDPRSTEELIRIALTEPDEHAAWEPVTVLHRRGTRDVLEAAERLCGSSVAKERELGANILGQLGIRDRTFPEECFQCLVKMLQNETDPDVLQAIAVAFGHLHDPRCISLLIPLKNHPDEDVRFGLVHGVSGHNDDRAVQTLIELSQDKDNDVRNWATFGLGSLIDADTPEIRAALWARLKDPFEEACLEAIAGLARRKDERVVDPILEKLCADSVAGLVIEAAEEIGDLRLHQALLQLKARWPDDRASEIESLERAIAACNHTHKN
jgi:HEAT repeat protein